MQGLRGKGELSEWQRVIVKYLAEVVEGRKGRERKDGERRVFQSGEGKREGAEKKRKRG